MKLIGLVPEKADLSLEALLAEAEHAARTPFDPLIQDLVATFSERLLATPDIRRTPELVALGFWTRRAALARLNEDFQALATLETFLVPRGFVLHFPPANVDTMFVYSAVLSLLVGNRNIVRLSQRTSPTVELLCSVWRSVLAEARFQELRGFLTFLTYPHDAEITRQLSEAADVRVIWGGDSTVRTIRAVPMAPTATEIAFPDRFSFAAIQAKAFATATPAEQRALAERFFNDAYWFDQAGCSSPRLVVWCGTKNEAAAASQTFFGVLDEILRARHHQVTTGDALRKLTFTAEASIDRPVHDVRRFSNELSVVSLESLDHFDREHCGSGLFLEAQFPDLAALAPFVRRKDQTLTHFGFSEAELRALIALTSGRGLQRLVPVGEALSFHRYWDGFDLLQSLTQRIHLRLR